MTQQQPRPKPTGEDYLRAVGYIAIAAWAVVFMAFPPDAFRAALDDATRFLWLGAALVGAIVATVGSLSRIDFKVELPGMALIMIGPLFYCASQIYYIVYPNMLTAPNPTSRYALSIYAIIPALLLLPRAWGLYRDSRQLRSLAKSLKNGVLSKEAEK